MDYKRIDKGKYHFHFMKTNRFKTILMNVNFKQEITENKITERELLAGILSNSSMECPTLRDMILKKEDLYQLGYGCSSVTSGNYIIFKASCKFIHEKYTEESMNEKSIRFFLDCIFKPNIEENHFKKNIFDLEKNNYLEFLEGKDDDPSRYANYKFNCLFGKGTPLAFDHSGNIEILKQSNEESIYQSYLDMIENSIVDIFFIGNMEEEDIFKMIEPYFENRKNNVLEKSHYVELLDTEFEEVKEITNFKQSKLRMGLQIKNITEYERKYVLPIYNFILGGDSDSLLFKNVREKNSLCYDISSSIITIYSALRILAGISSNNYDKTVSIIKEMLEYMKEGKFEEEELDKVKLNYQTSYKEIIDSPMSICNILESHEYLGYEFPEERMKEIEKVTKDMVVEFAKKVELKVIYFVEGKD